MRQLGTLFFCFLALSCGKSKSTENTSSASPAITNEPRPALSAEAKAQASASSAAAAAEAPLPKGQRFRLVHKSFPGFSATLLDPPAIAIYNPRAANETTIVVLSDAGVQSYPIDPGGSIMEKAPDLKEESPYQIDFSLEVGGAPTALCAHPTWGLRYSDPEEHEYKRTGGVFLQWNGKAFDFKHCDIKTVFSGRSKGRPPRELDDALLSATIRNAEDRLVWGTSSPAMLVADKSLYLLKGKRWSAKKAAEWTTTDRMPRLEATRLDNGQTFVLNGGYLVDAEGNIEPVVMLDEQGKLLDAKAETGMWIGNIPVLVSKNQEYFMPEDRPFFKPAELQAREPSKAADANQAAADSGFPAPAEFAAGCTTPFVLLATPKSAKENYSALLDGLYSKGYGFLQDELIFIEYRAGGMLYFGAQAKNEKMAEKLVKAMEKNVPSLKAELKCADIGSKIPDRYAPPPGARVIGLNLSTGEIVPFD